MTSPRRHVSGRRHSKSKPTKRPPSGERDLGCFHDPCPCELQVKSRVHAPEDKRCMPAYNADGGRYTASSDEDTHQAGRSESLSSWDRPIAYESQPMPRWSIAPKRQPLSTHPGRRKKEKRAAVASGSAAPSRGPPTACVHHVSGETDTRLRPLFNRPGGSPAVRLGRPNPWALGPPTTR